MAWLPVVLPLSWGRHVAACDGRRLGILRRNFLQRLRAFRRVLVLEAESASGGASLASCGMS